MCTNSAIGDSVSRNIQSFRIFTYHHIPQPNYSKPKLLFLDLHSIFCWAKAKTREPVVDLPLHAHSNPNIGAR